MPIYEFRCDTDGSFSVARAVGAAGPVAPCPSCGSDGRRRFSAPMLGRGDRGVAAAIERSEASRERPEVVSSLPPARSPARHRPAPANPALRRLPRP